MINRAGFRKVATASACGLYVDHIIGGSVPSRSGQTGKKNSSGK